MLFAALAGLALLVALLYVAVASFALDPVSYPQEPPFDAMATELAGYLSGDGTALSPSLFTERERLHMVDVLALFAGGRRMAAGCLVGGLLLGVASLMAGGRRRFGTGLLYGLLVFALVALCLGTWAAVDFDGWFRWMHEIVFTNDLWLLDPAESMLIRMMPLDFFMRAVRTIALRFGLGAAALLAIGLLCRLTGRREEGV